MQQQTTAAAELLPRCFARSEQDAVVVEAAVPQLDDARSFLLEAAHPSHLNRQMQRSSGRRTSDQPFVVAMNEALREEVLGNGGTSTPDKSAVEMTALRNADREVSALAPPRPPVFRSTYLGPPEAFQLARAILGPPLLHQGRCNGKPFFTGITIIYR